MLLQLALDQIHRRLAARPDLEPSGPVEAMDAGYASDSDRDPDGIVAGQNREMELRERGRLEARARRLREAIRRVDEGTYGRCVDCSEAIPRPRLTALPEAERCVRCQETADAERDGDGHFRRIPRPLVERLDEEGA